MEEVHIDCDDITEEEPNVKDKKFYSLLKEELLPDDANLQNSYYEAKNIIKELGVSYDKIDACTNDCMLYWKEYILLLAKFVVRKNEK